MVSVTMVLSKMKEDFSQPGTLLRDKYVLLMVKLIYHHVSRLPVEQR